jgi:hypothetical protein
MDSRGTQMRNNPIITGKTIKAKMDLFVTVPESSINSWDSWFIFNLRKINTWYNTVTKTCTCKRTVIVDQKKSTYAARLGFAL